jgi:hypothetical protein
MNDRKFAALRSKNPEDPAKRFDAQFAIEPPKGRDGMENDNWQMPTNTELDAAYSKLIRDLTCEEHIILARGALVLLLVNTHRELGCWNGSVGIVHDFEENGNVVVDFRNGQRVSVEPHTWSRYDHSVRCKVTCRQIPLILGYALSIHKGQGMTLEQLVVDIGPKVFATGQAYVALSRVRTLDGLFLKGFASMSILADPKVVELYRNLRSAHDTATRAALHIPPAKALSRSSSSASAPMALRRSRQSSPSPETASVLQEFEFVKSSMRSHSGSKPSALSSSSASSFSHASSSSTSFKFGGSQRQNAAALPQTSIADIIAARSANRSTLSTDRPQSAASVTAMPSKASVPSFSSAMNASRTKSLWTEPVVIRDEDSNDVDAPPLSKRARTTTGDTMRKPPLRVELVLIDDDDQS